MVEANPSTDSQIPFDQIDKLRECHHFTQVQRAVSNSWDLNLVWCFPEPEV